MTAIPTPETLLAAMEATWPPASSRRLGPWRLRDGAGGGKRVSAATVEGDWHPDDIARAAAAMTPPLFMLRPQDAALDAALTAQGYRLLDPVVLYAAPLDAFAPSPPTTLAHWPPLPEAAQLWASGGIGPARLAVMQRAATAKTVLLARKDGVAAGVAFVAVHDGIAMLHALDVSPPHRRQGFAQILLAGAAQWSAGHGAARLALAVTEANLPARGLYQKLGMNAVTRYHYRQHVPDQPL